MKDNEENIKRPMWKSVVFPFAGIVLIVIGIVGWILPLLPGIPLIVIGIPLLFSFHKPTEKKMRSYLLTLIERLHIRDLFKKQTKSTSSIDNFFSRD